MDERAGNISYKSKTYTTLVEMHVDLKFKQLRQNYSSIIDWSKLVRK